MTQADAHTAAPSPEPIVDPQRQALSELLARTAARDDGEAAVRAGHEERRRVAEVQRQRSLRRLAKRRERYEAQARAEHERDTAGAVRAFAEAEASLASEHGAARERVGEELDRARAAARKELEHTIWVAESVYDAKKAKAAQLLEEVEARSKAYADSIGAIEGQAAALLKRYGAMHLAASPARELAFGEGQKPDEVLAEQHRRAEAKLAELGSLQLPQWTEGLQLWVIGFLLVAGAGAGLLFAGEWQPTRWLYVGLPVVAAAVAVSLWGLSRLARKRVREAYLPLAEAAAWARSAADRWVMDLAMRNKQKDAQRRAKRDEAVAAAKAKFTPILREIADRKARLLAEADAAHGAKLAERIAARDAETADADARLAERLGAIGTRYGRCEAMIQARFDGRVRRSAEQAASERAALGAEWASAWGAVERLAAEEARLTRRLFPAWDAPLWRDWTPPTEHPPGVRFGYLHVDRRAFEAPGGERDAAGEDGEGGRLTLPAMMRLADKGSVLWRYGDEGRAEAVHAVQAVMARLLTTLPPGRARLTIIDPVALGQNFAGFMHLVDYEEDLVGKRIWTASEHIEARLAGLTEHMENVIQKYLRNEFPTIESYNAVAGELAEPYRFLVITDFPTNFSETAAQRLRSILRSGPRCGVYTLIAVDERQKLPGGIELKDLEAHSIALAWDEGASAFGWKDPVFGRFPLDLDAPPDEETVTRLMHRVGQGAKDNLRVEVPFAQIAPGEGEFWSRDSRRELRVPIGRTGATRRQELVLGRDVAQHALIAGKTGSGKSTLLHVMVTNLAMWYSPDEVEFYLIDFKKGVEFKTYAEHKLPHARAVAIESDREFGLSVLQRLDGEITRRGEIFRKAGVQNLADYRDTEGAGPMPRALLMIDEFQEFFSQDDKLAQDANILMDRLVRQGRAFGVHVVLGSQTLAGSGLGRATMGQMAVRIALQCSEADAQLILADDNTAARLLNRPGEAIYNDAGGLIEGNSPFQVSWLSDAERDAGLAEASRRAAEAGGPAAGRELIVFEGNAPAALSANGALRAALSGAGPASVTPLRVPLGEAIAIKDPTAVELRRQGGNNVVIIGQQDETAAALTAASLLTLAALLPRDAARFLVLDATPPDAAHAGLLPRIVAGLPHDATLVEHRDIAACFADLAGEVQRRIDANELDGTATFLVIHGLQRYRMLRKQEDDFSFSSSLDDEPKAPRPDKDFVTVLREGPPVGVHTLAWSDSLSTLERTLDRQAIREFDNRVLMQMSSADSSNLIDSPAASQLGSFRALYANEERGVLEKFRPYGVPGDAFVAGVLDRLAARSGGTSQPVPSVGQRA